MNRPFKQVAPAGVSSPSPIVGTPATPSHGASLANGRADTGEAEVSSPVPSVSPTLCPQCDTPLSDRITDEDTQMSYPCDPGEGFCEQCDAVWTDEYLTSPAPSSTLTIEEVEAQIAKVFNPLWKPKGYERIEL